MSIRNKSTSLLRLAQERAASKKVEEDHKKQEDIAVPCLSKDCIWNILIRLPINSLPHSRFVCKSWYDIINSPTFIDAHLHRSQTVLIFLCFQHRRSLSSVKSVPNTFSVESSFLPTKSGSIFGEPTVSSKSIFYMGFMEFKNGKCQMGEYNITCSGNIRGTCNGLVLLDNKLKKGGLLVMNPVTRKIIALPLGTISSPHNDSYGFAFINATGDYKVVHLFRDMLGYINCETLYLGTRVWREVNGPTFGLFGWLGNNPVSAIDALHWIPEIDRSDYLVSMEMENDKFTTIALPQSCQKYDGIIEMGGFLCFVTHEELNVDVWILKGLCGEVWTKQHCITRGCILDMVPLLSLGVSGDIIFKRDEDGSLYIYNFELQELRKIEMEAAGLLQSNLYMPHVNSLVSWK